MIRHVWYGALAVTALLLGTLGCASESGPEASQEADGPEATAEAAIAEIERLGGMFEVDEQEPVKLVTKVDLSGTQLDDAVPADENANLPRPWCDQLPVW